VASVEEVFQADGLAVAEAANLEAVARSVADLDSQAD
jgi:hypothetical protein